MPRIKPVDPAEAQGKAKTLLDGIQKSMGMTPNLMRSLANSPAALEAYLGLMSSLGGTSIDGKTRESIALATSGINGCEYCSSAHTAIGKMQGLSAEEAQENLYGRSSDADRGAVLRFARAVVEKRGWVDDLDLKRARQAGLGDREITEIVTIVAATIFTNYFNHVAQTVVDFPLVSIDASKLE